MPIELRYHPKLRGIWPPEPAGAHGRGAQFPLKGEDILTSVYYYAPIGGANAKLSLTTRFGQAKQMRDLLLEDPLFAERLAARLRSELGRTIDEIGRIQLSF